MVRPDVATKGTDMLRHDTERIARAAFADMKKKISYIIIGAGPVA